VAWQFSEKGRVPGIAADVDLNWVKDEAYEQVWGNNATDPKGEIDEQLSVMSKCLFKIRALLEEL
jgi:hypothetical protein